ncbi:MAG: hypothetical protein M3Z03_16215 [Actinomycetota bacterium]|nr:hypothetical protein [Actinomycetota bacterium]
MELDVAQLSSLSSSLDQLTQRITSMAEGFAGAPREDLAADLYDIERHLNAASRRMRTLLDRA